MDKQRRIKIKFKNS